MPTVVTPKQTPSAAPVQGGATPVRRWVVGTLCYSAAGLAVLFFWLLLGDFAQNMKERAINPISMVMLRGFDAPDWLVGLLIGSIPAALGLLLSPAISVKSDRYRGRFGRRIPFVLLPTPFIVLAMFGLALTPDLGAWLHHRLEPTAFSLQSCRIAIFAFFWTALEIASVIANSLFGALINDVVPPAIVGRFFGLFRCVGLLAGIIFNYWLMGQAQDHYRLLFAGLGLLYGLGIVLMCLMVKEGEYPPPPPAAPLSPRQMISSLLSYLKDCYGNRFFLCFFLATTLGGLSLAPVNTFAVYHGRSVQMSDDLYGKCIAVSYCISLLMAYPLGILADRFHPLRIGILAMALYAGVTAYGFFFARTAHTFFIALALHTVISGSYITATASIAQRLLPRAKFAEICSAGGIIGALIGMFVAPSLGLFIQQMNHEYRYVFLLASALALLTCTGYALLLRQYQSRGGDHAYTPPQDTTQA